MKLQHAIHGCLQGGTPSLVSQTSFLGVPQSQGVWQSRPRHRVNSKLLCECEVDLVLRSVETKAAIARQKSCSIARFTPWPLIARRFHLTFAVCCIAYMAPLSIAHPRAGLRFSMIQERWVQAVLYGVGIGLRHDRMPRDARLRLLGDLGWPHLWRKVQAIAISLYARMQTDPPSWPHAVSARQTDAVGGSWFFAVQSFMTKFGIPLFSRQLTSRPPNCAMHSGVTRLWRLNLGLACLLACLYRGAG